MFEALGYECREDIDGKYIVYVEKGNPWNFVKFIRCGVVFPTENGFSRRIIDYQLIKAIAKQCEELGLYESKKLLLGIQ